MIAHSGILGTVEGMLLDKRAQSELKKFIQNSESLCRGDFSITCHLRLQHLKEVSGQCLVFLLEKNLRELSECAQWHSRFLCARLLRTVVMARQSRVGGNRLTDVVPSVHIAHVG